MGRQAFVSYAREDESFTRWLVGELVERGVSLRTDQQLAPATAWSGAIDDAIAGSWHLVLVLSPHSASSHQVRRELDIATRLRRPIVPVRIADVDGEPVPPEVSSRQYLDMTSGSQTEPAVIDSLVARLRHDVAVDLSHSQRDWVGLVEGFTRLGLDHKLMEGDLMAHKDELENTAVLAMALPCGKRPNEVPIDRRIAEHLESWVRRGHGLLLMGYYAANLHHWTKPNDLVKVFDGRGFEDDLVLPPSAGMGDLARQAYNYDEGLFATEIVAKPFGHAMMSDVDRLELISSCSLRLGGKSGDLDLYSCGGSLVFGTDTTSTMAREGNYYPPPYPWSGAPGAEPAPVLSAFEYNGGRVAMVGTWKLFSTHTVGRAHNARFVHNLLEWLAEPALSARFTEPNTPTRRRG